MNEVREMRGDERLEHAMSVAERRYGVPRLLMPKGLQILEISSFGYILSCSLRVHFLTGVTHSFVNVGNFSVSGCLNKEMDFVTLLKPFSKTVQL